MSREEEGSLCLGSRLFRQSGAERVVGVEGGAHFHFFTLFIRFSFLLGIFAIGMGQVWLPVPCVGACQTLADSDIPGLGRGAGGSLLMYCARRMLSVSTVPVSSWEWGRLKKGRD